MKVIFTLGLGIAALGVARLFATVIAEERRRRDALREETEAIRWEGEGGNPVTPQSAFGEM